MVTASPPIIEFQHVFKSYGRGVNALSDVNFRIDTGELVFVAGPSGAGKSTLLRLAGGMISPSRGRIRVRHQDITRLSVRARPYLRRSVGVILQDTHLLHDRSAFDNVLFPLIVTGQDASTAQARARAAIDKVGLSGKERFLPVELSGGDQQRLAIARAIVNRPAILIADEPTANLDPESAGRILDVFRDFNRVGVTMLIATHDHGLIARHHNRVLYVDGGGVSDHLLPEGVAQP